MFKGSGFYLTDYGKNAHSSKGPAKPAAKSDATGGESKSESKSESQPSGEAKPSADAKPTAAPPKKPSAE